MQSIQRPQISRSRMDFYQFVSCPNFTPPFIDLQPDSPELSKRIASPEKIPTPSPATFKTDRFCLFGSVRIPVVQMTGLYTNRRSEFAPRPCSQLRCVCSPQVGIFCLLEPESPGRYLLPYFARLGCHLFAHLVLSTLMEGPISDHIAPSSNHSVPASL